MQKIRFHITRAVFGLAAIVLLLFSPVVAFAETPTAGSQKTTGPTSPTGADAKTYHFNESTGLWENDHYTWDPVTKETKPKDTPTYTHNPETNTWDTQAWHYDAAAQKYVAQPTPTPDTPASANQSQAKPSTSSTSTDGSLHSSANTTSSADNTVTSTATSGDATVARNTTGGNATSGNASAIANILNLLQSSWTGQNGNLATFNTDINGDIVGDLLINPSNYTGNLPVTSANNNVDIHVADDSSLNNNVDLKATSGDATVKDNTSAGNATTGSATAMANVINLINSMISAGQSFVGNININGNFEGDILLPQDLHDQLLASNAPRVTLDVSKVENGNVLGDFDNSQAISNAVNLGAQSGNATVSGNTSAGNSQTGKAITNLTVFNLTGRDIIGSNALLVFVNVLGNWVGMIMDAPAGTTSALIGGGISSDAAATGNTEITGGSNSQINNNINVAAASGNATVSNNTSAGNATSGDTKASASIANIANSQLSLANWFGMLFINVLGSWHGSFGVDTPMGNRPTTSGPINTGTTASPNVQVFHFASNSTGTTASAPISNRKMPPLLLASSSSDDSNSTPTNNQEQVLGSTTNKPTKPNTAGKVKTHNSFNPGFILITLAISLALLGADQVLTRVARRRLAHQTSIS